MTDGSFNSANEKIVDVLNGKSRAAAFQIAAVVFFLVFVSYVLTEARSIIQQTEGSIEGNSQFLVNSIKLGDYVVVRSFIKSLQSPDRVVFMAIRSLQSDSWLIHPYGEYQESPQTYKNGLDWHLSGSGLLVHNSFPLGNSKKWIACYSFIIPFSVVITAFLAGLVIMIVFQAYARSLVLKAAAHIADPLRNITKDIHNYRFNSGFDTSNYRSGIRFFESDSLEHDVRKLVSHIEAQSSELREIEVLKAIEKQRRQVAHDIQSPLGALSTSLATFATNPSASARVIERAINRICDITDDLKRPSVKPSDISLSTDLLLGIEQILEEKQAEYPNLSLTLNSDVEVDELFVAIQKKELLRILSNILNNAVEAVKGKIPEISISVSLIGTQAKLDIFDNGSGITDEDLLRIFDYGFTKNKQKGTGLGLSHAKETLVKLGGSIKIASELNFGTTVTIFLPITRDH